MIMYEKYVNIQALGVTNTRHLSRITRGNLDFELVNTVPFHSNVNNGMYT
jgi:hypothetical protein